MAAAPPSPCSSAGDDPASESRRPLSAGRGRRRTQTMQTRHERQARNEALLREVNEQIECVDQATQEAGLSEDATFEFLCECGRVEGADVSCHEHVEMTLAEYEDVRSQDDRFALVPGHAKHRNSRNSSGGLTSSSSWTRSRKPSQSSRTILAARLRARFCLPPSTTAAARHGSSSGPSSLGCSRKR